MVTVRRFLEKAAWAESVSTAQGKMKSAIVPSGNRTKSFLSDTSKSKSRAEDTLSGSGTATRTCLRASISTISTCTAVGVTLGPELPSVTLSTLTSHRSNSDAGHDVNTSVATSGRVSTELFVWALLCATMLAVLSGEVLGVEIVFCSVSLAPLVPSM